jgi:hypothetical protein
MFVFWQWRYAVWQKAVDMSKVLALSVTTHRPADGVGKNRWNIDKFLPHYTAQHSEDSQLHTRSPQKTKTHKTVAAYSENRTKFINPMRRIRDC